MHLYYCYYKIVMMWSDYRTHPHRIK